MEYLIADKIYTQKPLVLGQWRQLMGLLKGLTIPGNVDALGLANILGDSLPLALAVILNPDGIPLKDKDLPALADELEFSIEPEMIIQVIDDFFTCNPLPLILEKFNQAVGKMGVMMKTPSTPSSASSPVETSSEEMQSSGDSPLSSASPG